MIRLILISKLIKGDNKFTRYFNFCKPPFEGYSGVAIFSKFQPMSLKYDFGMKHNQEGRTITVEFEKFYLVTTYVPNAGNRLEYRVNEWDTDFRIVKISFMLISLS